MDNKKAESFIQRFAKKQATGSYHCPRCGKANMMLPATRNALSRCYSVYVCDVCGIDEALRAMKGNHIPAAAWDVAINPEEYDLMSSYYFTFGSDPEFPYRNAWIEIVASSWEEATELFRQAVPDRTPGTLNCSFCYDQEKWEQLDPPLHWIGYECVTVITREEFLPI